MAQRCGWPGWLKSWFGFLLVNQGTHRLRFQSQQVDGMLKNTPEAVRAALPFAPSRPNHAGLVQAHQSPEFGRDKAPLSVGAATSSGVVFFRHRAFRLGAQCSTARKAAPYSINRG